MKIDVVIPNYNGLALLKENLPKVIESVNEYKGSVIIVDDCSEESEFKTLRDFIKKLENKNIILLRNERNLGFSSTVNRGVNNSNADFVVLLNTDVVPENDFLEAALRDLQSDENLFGIGFMDKSIEDGKTILRGRGVAFWEKGFLAHRRGEVDKTDTFWISGGSSIVRRDLFKKLSGFDSLYDPFYWEDIDLSYRARKSDYSIKFQPESVVVHKHYEGSIKKNFSDFQIKITAYRNQFIFLWKNISDPNLIISHIFWFPYHAIFAFLRFDIPFFLGFATAFMKLPAIMERRSIQKQLYKKQDKDLFN